VIWRVVNRNEARTGACFCRGDGIRAPACFPHVLWRLVDGLPTVEPLRVWSTLLRCSPHTRCLRNTLGSVPIHGRIGLRKARWSPPRACLFRVVHHRSILLSTIDKVRGSSASDSFLTPSVRRSRQRERGRLSGGSGEAHLPTQQHQAEAFPRLPCPHGHHRWSQRPQAPPREGPQASRTHRAHEEHLSSSEDSPQSSGLRAFSMDALQTRDGLTLPRSSRLRRTSDYRRVQGRGRKVRRRSLLVLWLPRRDHPEPRVGLTVSKKVGKAVVRNQVKRWLREAVRHELHRLVRPVDVVLIAHPSAAESSAEALRDEVRGAFREVMGEVSRPRSRRHQGRRLNSHRKPDPS
jgi:ribonuclease P protein component